MKAKKKRRKKAKKVARGKLDSTLILNPEAWKEHF